MYEISKQIVEILSNNDIKEDKYLEEIAIIYEDIKFSLWKEIVIAPNIFNFIKSLCFYNFEHKINNKDFGKTDIRYYGSKYNILMYEIKDGYIKSDLVENFIKELEDILKNIENDKELKSVTLFSEKDFDWKIDESNSTKMIVYNSNENPQQYGYHTSGRNYTGIIGNDGKQIVIEEDIILCAINDIDKNRELPLVKSTLNNLLSKCKEALDNKKGIYLNMNDYNYNY